MSDAPFKITSIGFLTTSTEDQNATIDFDVTITDADGDSETQLDHRQHRRHHYAGGYVLLV